ESLTERLDQALKTLTGRGKLSEAVVDAGLREVRLALLEADVNYKVVKDFVASIRARAVGAEVMDSLNPGQQLVKIVDQEMVRLLGDQVSMGYAPSPPTVIVHAGLQGSGKTTTAGKLALFTRREGHRPLLVSTDVRRPAAMEQLEILAKSINAPSYTPRGTDPVAIARESLAEARRVNADVVIVDTAGRLQVDEDLLAASQAREMEKKLRAGRLTLTDFMEQLKQVKKMGPLEGIIGMLPGAGKIKNLAGALPTDDQLKEMEAIILSMTPLERERPEV